MANSKEHPTTVALRKVRDIFPQAMFATPAGECDSCHLRGLYFWRPDNEFPIIDGYIHGGFYCESCGFGNAGAMLYEEMQAYWPDSHVHFPKSQGQE